MRIRLLFSESALSHSQHMKEDAAKAQTAVENTLPCRSALAHFSPHPTSTLFSYTCGLDEADHLGQGAGGRQPQVQAAGQQVQQVQAGQELCGRCGRESVGSGGQG